MSIKTATSSDRSINHRHPLHLGRDLGMDGGEIQNVIKVWTSVLVSLSYCYGLAKVTPKGLARFVFILPILLLFLLLPLKLSSMHLGGSTAFFIAWLANFKLIMFAFGTGPLAFDANISLVRFLAVACFPIRIQHQPTKHTSGSKSPLNYGIKLLLLAIMVGAYNYTDSLPQKVVWVMYCFHIYFCLEIILAMVAVLAQAVLGMELEPQFNEPYLSTSLQDFWGRRWNIMVTRILRPTVYEPVVSLSTPFVGRTYAPLPAVLGTFVVSAMMHELIFYYLGRVPPTGEITAFFLLHGVCLMVEIAVKKKLKRRWQLPRPVASVLSVCFVMATAFWLFLPPLLRCRADSRAFEEYAVVWALVKDVVGRLFPISLKIR